MAMLLYLQAHFETAMLGRGVRVDAPSDDFLLMNLHRIFHMIVPLDCSTLRDKNCLWEAGCAKQ
jgi:hypothetical protein